MTNLRSEHRDWKTLGSEEQKKLIIEYILEKDKFEQLKQKIEEIGSSWSVFIKQQDMWHFMKIAQKNEAMRKFIAKSAKKEAAKEEAAIKVAKEIAEIKALIKAVKEKEEEANSLFKEIIETIPFFNELISKRSVYMIDRYGIDHFLSTAKNALSESKDDVSTAIVTHFGNYQEMEFVEEHGIDYLIELAQKGTDKSKVWAANALGRLMRGNKENQKEVYWKRGLEVLGKLAHEGTLEQKEAARKAFVQSDNDYIYFTMASKLL